MPIERYFIDEPIEVNQIKSLTGAEFHHLARVTRIRPGEKIELVNGKGIVAQVTVEAVEKEKALLQIDSVEQDTLSIERLILAQAMPKVNRLDFILEKGTELGVDEFWLFPGDLSIKKDFSDNQMERAHAMTIAAMKQCGRLTLPIVKLMPRLKNWPEIDGKAYFGDTDQAAPHLMKNLNVNNFPVTFFIGPESGWSEDELTIMKERGIEGVKLHENILRTDTASLVAVSLIRHALMS